MIFHTVLAHFVLKPQLIFLTTWVKQFRSLYGKQLLVAHSAHAKQHLHSFKVLFLAL